MNIYKTDQIKFYFVYCKKLMEREIIQKLQPPNLLLSYYYFKNKPLEEVVESLGYKPNIMLDSGAYSAWNSGKQINIHDYMQYIKDNEKWIETYISCDIMQDAEGTFDRFNYMREQGFTPVPVFHYKTDEYWLDQYYEMGERYIALGSTIPELKKTLVRMWINELAVKYLDLEFHVLGTSRREILDHCDLHSCDSSGWIKTGTYRGKTRSERIKIASNIMQRLMEITC